MDDTLGSITGTATFEKVLLERSPSGDTYEMTGYYHDSTTVYRSPTVTVGGLSVDGYVDGELVFENQGDDDPMVFVIAGADGLHIQANAPDTDTTAKD